MTMNTIKNPEKFKTDAVYGIIHIGEKSIKLALDFRYMFESRLNLRDTIEWNESSAELTGKHDSYICCAYDCNEAKKILTDAGFVYEKDFFFAEDFFCLLDDWKGLKIAYKSYPWTFIGWLKNLVFGYTAKHGIILYEDRFKDILKGENNGTDVKDEKKSSRRDNRFIQRFFYAVYLFPAVIESFPQIFAKRNNYRNYDYICFYNVSDAVKFKKDFPSDADRVITVEELKAHTEASLYMRAVYFDRRQNGCCCDTPYNSLWVGRAGTTRLCDCPDYLDLSCGNIGVTKLSDVWESPLAKIIRLSVINNTYTFCSRNLCGKLDAGLERDSLLKRQETKEKNQPSNINIANDYVCNLHCPSCRKNIYAKNDEDAEREIEACTDEILKSGWLDEAEKLIVGGGGEAFLSQNYKRILYGGAVKRKNIIIMTNGTLFTPSEWERLDGKYEHTEFMVSVDAATKETYCKVRCGGSFEKLMNNMEYLSKLRRENKVDIVKVIMIVQKANYTEIPDFINWAKEKGFDNVKLSHIRNWGTYEDEYFYENVSMFDRKGEMKAELAQVLKNPICFDPIVNMSWNCGEKI